jgi:hypothetical protein
MTEGEGPPSPSEGQGSSEGPPARQTFPRPSTRVQWATEFGRTAVMGWRQRKVFGEVEKYCFFVGYPRSGHSLVGSLLNAHPEMVIAHELDALGYVEHSFSRVQVYGLLLERDRVFASMGRRWTGYDYVVPHQHQGQWSRLRVIGDKRGQVSTARLAEHPGLLGKLRGVVRVPIRVIHVTRNPYDNVATMARRRAEGEDRRRAVPGPPTEPDLSGAIDRYAEMCAWVEVTRQKLGPEELQDIVYEKFVGEPKESLAGLCRFLGVEAEDSYLEDCAGVVWPQARRARDGVEWTEGDRERVEGIIGTYPSLAGYSWET